MKTRTIHGYGKVTGFWKKKGDWSSDYVPLEKLLWPWTSRIYCSFATSSIGFLFPFQNAIWSASTYSQRCPIEWYTSRSTPSNGPNTRISFCPLLNNFRQLKFRVIFSASSPVRANNLFSVHPYTTHPIFAQ